MEDLLASLTLEEKVGQLFFVRVPDTDAVSDVSTYHLGGYILFGRDTADKTADALIQTIQSYQDAAAVDTGIPLLIGVDEEGGTVVRVSSNPHLRASKFPSPQKAYASGGMEAVLGRYPREGPPSLRPGLQREPVPGGRCVHQPRRLYV